MPLFERSNRGLAPTPYGEIFARHAKIVLAQLRHAAEELEDLRVGYSGKVTVGTLLAASASILPDAIALLKKERPGVAISVDGRHLRHPGAVAAGRGSRHGARSPAR